MHQKLIVRNLGKTRYEKTLQAMQVFTEKRTEETTDEFWLVEHFPVFTQGQAGKPEHVLNPGNIPIIQSDRGGQVTYHGPGQLVLYTLLDIKRKNLAVRALVRSLEQSIIDLLADYNITATAQCDAPGVYVKEAKIASLGLRIRHGRSYHGLSLNIDMDLEPFQRINPCGYSGLQVTQISHFSLQPKPSFAQITTHLIKHLAHTLGYTTMIEPFQSQSSEETEKI